MIFGKERGFMSTGEGNGPQGPRCLPREKTGECQHCKKVEDFSYSGEQF